MTKYTPNYQLDQYEGTDVPNLADQYNNAMGKIDTALHLQAGDVAELANKLSTVNQSIAAINTEIEGVNAELAALGITDDETAAALLATINKVPGMETVQEQHTQEISDVMGDVAKIEADYVSHTFPIVDPYGPDDMAPSPSSGSVYVSINDNNSILKVWGNMNFHPGSYQRTTVAGFSSVHGIKVTLNTPLPRAWRKRIFSNCAFTYLVDSETYATSNVVGYSIYTGEDGNIYLFCSTDKAFSVEAGRIWSGITFQIPMFVGL